MWPIGKMKPTCIDSGPSVSIRSQNGMVFYVTNTIHNARRHSKFSCPMPMGYNNFIILVDLHYDVFDTTKYIVVDKAVHQNRELPNVAKSQYVLL